MKKVRYIPKDSCQKCQTSTVPIAALRQGETVIMFYYCPVCKHCWSCNYLHAALGPGW